MLDRALQRKTFELLKEHYPRGAIPVRDLDLDDEQAAANLRYLEQHGLCKSGVMIGADGRLAFGDSTITAAGLNFLEGEGGQSTPMTTLRTSGIRKHALRLAHEMYESRAGQVRHTVFDANDTATHLVKRSEEEVDATFAYLTSSRIMEAPYLGQGKRVRFTDYGRMAIEAAIDKPTNASGPFPPLNVVIGDIGAGAQVAVGSGEFVQERQDDRDHDILRDLVPLLRAASAEVRANGGERASSLLDVAESEAGHDGDENLLKRTLGRFASKFLSDAAGSAAHALVVYCKTHGLLP